MTDLIAPHGGQLLDLRAPPAMVRPLRAEASTWPSWTLTARQQCDLELLANGAFSPLSGFMTRRDWESVTMDLRLADGTLWPIPITLDVSEDVGRAAKRVGRLALRDLEGQLIAALTVEDVWYPDQEREARHVYGTTDTRHPGVHAVLKASHPVYVGGVVILLHPIVHFDFRPLRHTPAELRAAFAADGWQTVVAFQTRNPLHRAHQEMTLRAAREVRGALLLHPVVGMTRSGDVDHYTRVRCYQAVLRRYPPATTRLALLPLAMRMAGPREALWHAIIRKNYGCSHLIVGRDHAGPGIGRGGKPFYGPYDAQQLVRHHEAELGVTMVPFRELTYVRELDRHLPEDEVPAGTTGQTISGTELRRRLAAGQDIPPWFTFPEVANELKARHPPLPHRGLTVFFTGLCGSGKSTLARALQAALLERGDHVVTLLDGDIVRRNLSSELGFSARDRDLNVQRIGFVAAELTRARAWVICAPIAPYDAIRKAVRVSISEIGGFALVYVATPLETCEARDSKGLYAKARRGEIQAFTGISDPYEPPDDADVVIDTTDTSPEEGVRAILEHLQRVGYLTSAS